MSPVLLVFMRVLEVMFFVGIAGSAVVVTIATWEDMHELFSKDEEQAANKTSHA